MISSLAPQDTQNWLHSSVDSFFTTCNWENQAQYSTAEEVAMLEQAAAPEVLTELSFELKVKQFFAAMRWDGTAVVAMSAAPESESFSDDQTESKFTLSDFSDLF
jgi:hypothetical protein